MSGGKFNYDQYKIKQIAYDIEQVIIDNDSDERNQWGDTKGRHYPPDVIEQLRRAVHILRAAAIYAHRVDWLLSGDDGEACFLKRLQSDLDQLERNP